MVLQLSAIGLRLSAIGPHLSAIGLRLSARGPHLSEMGLSWTVSTVHCECVVTGDRGHKTSAMGLFRLFAIQHIPLCHILS